MSKIHTLKKKSIFPFSSFLFLYTSSYSVAVLEGGTEWQQPPEKISSHPPQLPPHL